MKISPLLLLGRSRTSLRLIHSCLDLVHVKCSVRGALNSCKLFSKSSPNWVSPPCGHNSYLLLKRRSKTNVHANHNGVILRPFSPPSAIGRCRLIHSLRPLTLRSCSIRVACPLCSSSMLGRDNCFSTSPKIRP